MDDHGLFEMILALALAIAAPPLTERQAERIAYRVCGPEGTVDWDETPDRHGRYRPEPHCNRNGWNGRRYKGAR